MPRADLLRVGRAIAAGAMLLAALALAGCDKTQQTTPSPAAKTDLVIMTIRPENWSIADFSSQREADSFEVSAGGDVVRFDLQKGCSYTFSLTDLHLASCYQMRTRPSDGPALAATITEAPNLMVTDWKDNQEPKLSGKRLPLKPGEMSRSLAIAPDGRHFLLGTESSLRLFDLNGRQLWQSAAPSIAWGVNITGDGRFALGTFGDGTIRWYDMQDGRERLAFFTARSTRYTYYPHRQHWVVWVPEGFFASDDSDPPDPHERWGSDEGDKLVGYKLSRGTGQEPEFISVDRLRAAFYRPDLLLARLQGEEDKIQQARAAIGDIRQVLAGSDNEGLRHR